MVTELNKLIYNKLITSGGVLLPEVGTLYIERKAATFISKKRVAAPRYELSFSSHRPATSIVESIHQLTGVSQNEALDIYQRWLDKVRVDGVVTIEGVGVLRNKSFVTDNEILVQLNLVNSAEIELVTKRNRIALYLSLLLLVPSIFVGVKYFVLPQFATEPQVEETIFEPITPVEDVVVEELIAENAVQAEVVEESLSVEIVEPEPMEADWRENCDIRHWTVIGSYSTEENLNRAIVNLEKQYPELKFTSFKLGSMYAVSPFGSTDREACEDFVERHRKDFTQIWIHTPKRYKD